MAGGSSAGVDSMPTVIIRQRRRHAGNAKLAHAFGLQGRNGRVQFFEEDHLLMRDVGVHGHFVHREIVVHEVAEARVHGQLFHEGRCPRGS